MLASHGLVGLQHVIICSSLMYTHTICSLCLLGLLLVTGWAGIQGMAVLPANVCYPCLHILFTIHGWQLFCLLLVTVRARLHGCVTRQWRGDYLAWRGINILIVDIRM